MWNGSFEQITAQRNEQVARNLRVVNEEREDDNISGEHEES